MVKNNIIQDDDKIVKNSNMITEPSNQVKLWSLRFHVNLTVNDICFLFLQKVSTNNIRIN